jgi:hypothetical protein
VPECWQITHEEGPFNAILDISTAAVYEVDCLCGTSALTNLIYVTTNAFTTNTGYITNGLVAWWKMSDAPGMPYATDSSGNVLNVPMIGSPTWSPNYLALNGTTQYGDAGSNAMTNLDGSMTICAWINTRSTALQGIVTKEFYQSSSSYGGWWFAIENGQLSWNLMENGTVILDNGLGIVPLGQWVFVAVTWSYTNISDYEVCFFVNGQSNSAYLSYDHQPITEEPSGHSDLFLGNLQVAPGAHMYLFDGSMRDVAIYNRALSAGEILTNFFNTEPSTNVPSPDLLYYKMTESNQTSVPIHLVNSASTNGPTGLYPSNSSTIWTDGPAGRPNTALHFDGVSSFIDTGISAPFNFTNNPFTINVWMGPYGGGYYFMGNDNYATNGWYLSEVQGSTGISFGGETNNIDYAIITEGVDNNWGASSNWPGEWNMVTITYDGINTPLIYVNAEVWETDYTFKSPASSTKNLILGLGKANPNGASHLDGDMWLPQIWSINLSPSEVANLFFNQKNGNPWPP